MVGRISVLLGTSSNQHNSSRCYWVCCFRQKQVSGSISNPPETNPNNVKIPNYDSPPPPLNYGSQIRHWWLINNISGQNGSWDFYEENPFLGQDLPIMHPAPCCRLFQYPGSIPYFDIESKFRNCAAKQRFYPEPLRVPVDSRRLPCLLIDVSKTSKTDIWVVFSVNEVLDK